MVDGILRATDPSQNYIERYSHPLDPLFHPLSVAVIGAKDDRGSVGRTIMVNLMAGSFGGRIYPVNPKRKEVLGLKAFPAIADVPEQVDLAVIITPAKTVPKIIEECVQVKAKSAIVISAGFKELGEPGLHLEALMLSYAKLGKMPIIGPNCLGVMNPIYGLNATFAKGMALPGNLAFISQSGAMCTAVLDWSLQNNVGFSAFVSIGSMADVNWGTLIDYLGSDPHTHSLLLYIETVGDARSFMTAAREVALEKPIILIKAGRTQAAALAAASHTGSLAGSDEVFDAALERIGVLRVDTISELFNMASVLAKQPRPKGPNLTIVTNAGGPGVLATDAVIFNKAALTPLPLKTIEALDRVLPPAWSHNNPVDILGDADASRYAKAAEILLQDVASDGLLVILSPQDMTDATAIALRIRELGKAANKPLLASWMGGESVRKGAEILSQAQIPVFEYPDDAAKTFATMWHYSHNLQSLYETPQLEKSLKDKHPETLASEQNSVKKFLSHLEEEGRVLLTEYESKQLLEVYGIPIVKTLTACTADEAIAFAKQLGFPVVLKLFSHTITHKTDIGGVKLNLLNEGEVKKAFDEIKEAVAQKMGIEYFQGVTVQQMVRHQGYELILGSSSDPQFGPVILFGMGGQLVEVFKDKALAIPPLSYNLACNLMEKTKIYEALKGTRGRKPVDISKLAGILVRFSRFIVENPRIKECDINPLVASESQVIALDARIVLHDFEIPEENLPRLAIRPYPSKYAVFATLKGGIPAILRPIFPEDEPLMIEFHRMLSENSVRQRYFEFMSLDERVAHKRLTRICFNDYDREWAIVAILEGLQKKIIGIGRLTRIFGTSHAQFKLIIEDSYHHLGLGTELLKHLLSIAKEEKIEVVDGYILAENHGMLKICKRLGFTLHLEKDSRVMHAELIIGKD